MAAFVMALVCCLSYASAATASLGDEEVIRDIDGLFRPVFNKLFGNASIASQTNKAQTRVGGEVLENVITYTVGRKITTADGFALHSELRNTGFAASPRVGSKPVEYRGTVVMSLMRSTSRRGYSFVINVDTTKQQIVVESWKLGSRSDRM
jgi:hypothetical protein